MLKRLRMVSFFCAFAVFASVVGTAPLNVSAQTQSIPSVRGRLVDQAGGVPIPNATIGLYQGSTRVAETKSGPDGTFTFPSEPSGIYYVLINAPGYQPARSDDVTVLAKAATLNVNVALSRASGSSTGIKEIGRVSASTGRNSISTSTTISQSLNSNYIQQSGYVRIGDALGTLPGVNTTGQSSSIGDDQGIDIRGFGTNETETLIDGHPIGPQGPGSGGFSGQVSPSYAIGQTIVTYGSGALGLYGTDSIGGTIDQQTLEPTRVPHASITQGFGNLGHSLTDLQSTGTIGKLGYAVVNAVEGAYGPYAPAIRPQPGLLGTDVSSANLAANTYETSGNYLLRNDLLKLRYQFNDKTTLTVSGLSATSWDDKSGNGDNCYFTYNYQLYQGQQIASSPNTLKDGNGNVLITCNATVAVNTNNGPACLSPGAYANATTGLAGGGPGPWQSHRVDDYHARFSQQLGNNLVTLDGFTNIYTTDYNRRVSGGGFDTSFYKTTGELISDDIATERNDFGFGFYNQHQVITGDQLDTGLGQIVPLQAYSAVNTNFFLRDEFQASSLVTSYLNAWLKRSNVTNKTTFDPRLSLVFHVSPADVFRVTGGRSDGDPSPELINQAPRLNQTPSNITPSCGGLTSVGSVSNQNLVSEQSNDLELGYGHRFNADDIIQVDGYYSFEKNRIFGGVLPITATGAPIPANLLAEYYARIAQFCPGKVPSLADLQVSSNYNAASARIQGLELTGRHRFSRQVYADYSYDIQSAVVLNVPASILQNDINTVNGAQLTGIPLHKASIGLDYSSNSAGLELHTDVFYLSEGNQYNRPAFFYGNAFATKSIGRHAAVNFGVLNVFNSVDSTVAAFGGAPFLAENQFGSSTSALNQLFNGYGGLQTGLLPRQYTLNLTLRI